MFIRIEPASGVPITRQVMDQIRARVAARDLLPGDRLPSVRDLARELAVNQNTILRVYERLTAEGLIERRHGNGTFVTATPSAKQLRREAEEVCVQISGLVRRATALGVDGKHLHRLVDAALEEIQGEKGTKELEGRRA